jgi:carbamoyl-phosphate synthase large subunit
VGQGPYVVKERFGAGSRGLGLNLSRDAALAHGAGLQAPIYQPFVKGEEISIDAWLDRAHRVKGLVLRRRERVVDGESQVTTTFSDAGLEAEAKRILESLTLTGPVVMQAFRGDNGKLSVIECNPRFGGASTTAIAAGLDIFYWTLLEAAGGDVGSIPFDRIPGEVRQIRVPSDIHVHGPGF